MTLSQLSDFWLHPYCARCQGRSSQYSIALLLSRQPAKRDMTLGQAVGLMKCQKCGLPPTEIWLSENAQREKRYGAGWAVRLV